MLFWTRHANFRRVENDIYDPSVRIIKNSLNSTIFWTRHLNSSDAMTQLGNTSTQLCDASTQLRDTSKMQLSYYNPNGLPYWVLLLKTTEENLLSYKIVIKHQPMGSLRCMYLGNPYCKTFISLLKYKLVSLCANLSITYGIFIN